MTPNWKWYKSDLPPKNGLKVMSCFSCGGGSSYGYKLAGYDVIANCEIDDAINDMYVKNHHPKYNYHMDIRDFLNLGELPDELYHLDVLDGSPPCSTFSMAGDREDAWGKEKKFREGQKMQRLDDLFFDFLNVVAMLNPKCVVAENVEGLLKGNAKGYVAEIVERFRGLGYDVQLFRLNSKFMGVPQARVRVFFVANRMGFPKLHIPQDQKPIVYGKIASNEYIPFDKDTLYYKRWLKRNDSDVSMGDTVERTENGKKSGFTLKYIKKDEVPLTLTAKHDSLIRFDVPGLLCDTDIKSIATFPQDYDFCGQIPAYVCGMSVPPLMMYGVADAIKRQWFKLE